MSNKRVTLNSIFLISGKCISKIGNILFDYANSVWIVSLNARSTKMMALYQISENLIRILMNIIGGVFADQSSRKKILIYTDLISGLVCLLLAFLFKTKIALYAVIIVNITLAVLSAFSSPTYKSIIKNAICKDKINRVNSLLNATGEIARVIAPLIAIMIVERIGVQGALFVDALSFFFSAACSSMIYMYNSDETSMSKKMKNPSDVFTSIFEGFKYLIKHKDILNLIVMSSFVNFMLAGYNLLIPYSNISFNRLSGNVYSLMLVYQAIGGIIGSFINAYIIKKSSTKIMFGYLFMNGISLILLPISYNFFTNIYICLIPVIMFGSFLTIFNIQFITNVQTNIEQEYLGRVFSIIFTVAALLMPIGSMFFTIVANPLDNRIYYFIGIGIVIISTLSLLNFSRTKR